MATRAARRPSAPGSASRGKAEGPPVRVLLVLASVLGLLAMLGVGSAVVFGAGSAKAGRGGHPGPVYAALPAMNFTLTDGSRLRELRLKVLLEMDPTADLAVVEPRGPRIVGALESRMAGVRASELSGTGGTRMVKDLITVAANHELRPLRVRQVLLQEMLVN